MNNQQPLFSIGRVYDDVTAARHRGADTSIEANRRANPTKHEWRLKVLGVVAELRQATLKEICGRLGKQMNELSGRCSELVADGQLRVVQGVRRDGCRVYEVAK